MWKLQLACCLHRLRRSVECVRATGVEGMFFCSLHRHCTHPHSTASPLIFQLSKWKFPLTVKPEQVFPGAAKYIIVHHHIILVYSVNAINKPSIFSKQFIRKKAGHFTRSFMCSRVVGRKRAPPHHICIKGLQC